MTRVSWRRVVLLLLPPLAVLAAIVYFGSPSGLAGSTLCLPFVGPRVAIDTSLRGVARTLAVAHEAAHATQCREQGAVRNYFERLSRAGRLDSELGAYCAEARAALRLGQRADLVVVASSTSWKKAIHGFAAPRAANSARGSCARAQMSFRPTSHHERQAAVGNRIGARELLNSL